MSKKCKQDIDVNLTINIHISPYDKEILKILSEIICCECDKDFGYDTNE